MRNKNTIIALLAIFTLICSYNLFMTYRQFSIEGELEEAGKISAEAEDNLRRDKGLMASYENAQRNAFSLGLDLQGGLFVTMEVGVEDILREYAANAIDADFDEALKNALAEKTESQENLVDLFYTHLQKVYNDKGRRIPQNANNGAQLLMARYFSSQSREIGSTMPDADVIAKLKLDTETAIENTFTIIRSRIDQFGVASPNLQLQAGTGRILLELPGVKDPKRVKKLLRNSAKLEFRETHTYRDVFPLIERIDNICNRIAGIDKADDKPADDAAVEPDTTRKDSPAANIGDPDVAAADPNAADPAVVDPAVVDPAAVDPAADDPAAVADAGDNLDDVLNQGAGITDSTNPDSPAVADPNAGLSVEEQAAKFRAEHAFRGLFTYEFGLNPDRPLIGIANTVDTVAINKWLNTPEVQDIIPSDTKFLWDSKPDPDRGEQFSEMLGLYAIKTNPEDKAPLEGNVITSARQDYDQGSTNASVSMNMNSEGAKIWARITKDNVGQSVAIILDDKVQSAPNVQGMINGGRSQITGNFTVEEAKDLANLLRAGALPVKAKILGDTTIGPTLGAENLSNGLWSFFFAFLVTIGFMIFYYRSSGIVANVALLINLFYILGVSAALNVVFTLPGLAAVVLTMGMAVDANVLIFERIREEQSHGKSFKAAIAAGFKNAFSSVMDANITTFLTGLILFSFGIGPIRGFAVSLMIGIVTSLISALFITRLVLEYYANKGKDSITFGSKFTTGIFSRIDIKMTARRKIMYMVSSVLVVGSIISIVGLGFKTGVDFKGGRQFELSFAQEVSPKDFREPLTAAFDNQAPVMRSMGDNKLLITTSFRNDEDNVSEEIQTLLTTTMSTAKPGCEPFVDQSTRVGPTVANDIRRSAVYSIIFSLIAIFLYILIRFRKYQYSLGAIAALFHDVVIVLGIFSFLGTMDFLPFSLGDRPGVHRRPCSPSSVTRLTIRWLCLTESGRISEK